MQLHVTCVAAGEEAPDSAPLHSPSLHHLLYFLPSRLVTEAPRGGLGGFSGIGPPRHLAALLRVPRGLQLWHLGGSGDTGGVRQWGQTVGGKWASHGFLWDLTV